ncbi:hypothetical protein [Furfurilactobacillus rossiae]|nr:hypothetical protein [Furfurilactobacillus rossiae]QFR66453.1 hypothetical protein LR814_04805 [Furfurilactobacillus rossiae]QLE61911.1 hypothetical protein LROSRS0_1866 [Furfurilactobacillus rossiae]
MRHAHSPEFTRFAIAEYENLLDQRDSAQEQFPRLNKHMHKDMTVRMSVRNGQLHQEIAGDSGSILVALLSEVEYVQRRMHIGDYELLEIKNAIRRKG